MHDTPAVRMPPRDVGGIDARVTAIMPHETWRRGSGVDDPEPPIDSGVGHLIDQQTAIG